MADSASEPPPDAGVDEEIKSNGNLSSSPAWSSQLQDGQQGEGAVIQSSPQADSFSSIESPIPNNFAQTRSPLSIDQLEQTTKSRYPSGENVEEESELHNSPQPRRISPFTTDFISTTPRSSVFTKRKVTPPGQLTKATIDAITSTTETEQQQSSPEQENVVHESTSNASSPELATNPNELTKHEPAGEASGVAQEVTTETIPRVEQSDIAQSPKFNENTANTDLSAVEDVTDSITLPGILTILDEEIDRQFTGEALEPDSTDSSSLTIVVTDSFEEPQPSWNPDCDEARQESDDESIVKNDVILFDAQPVELNDPEAANDQHSETKHEPLVQEDALAASGSHRTEPISIESSPLRGSDEDIATSSEMHSTHDTTFAPQIDEDQNFGEAVTIDSVDPSLSLTPRQASLRDSSLNRSSHDQKQLTSRNSFPHLTPLERTFLADFAESSPILKESKKSVAQASEDRSLPERIGTREGTKIPTRDFYELFTSSGTHSLDSSVASSDSDSQGSFPEAAEDISSPVLPDPQPVQTHMLVDYALQEFKVDLLRQIESVIKESTKPLMPARNSVAATLLARSLPPQMETGIRASVSNAQHEIMSAVELSKTEAVGCMLRATEANKAHSTEIADALRKSVLEHIDYRFEDLKKTFPTLKTERSVRFEAQPESNVVELLQPESLTALEQLPAILEQAKSVASTNTQEVSRKLEQYAAKAEAVSNLCTRLDETITSKQPLQNEIVSNLYNILHQSTSQNNAINDLTVAVNPLASLVKGVSYDTNLIDAKLAKNTEILTSITERTKALEEASEKFGETVMNAERNFDRAATKADHAAKTATLSNTAHVDRRFEALQGQILSVQAQLDQIVGALAKQQLVNIRSTNSGSTSHTTTLTKQASGSSAPGSDTASTRVEHPNSPPAQPTLSITATFELPTSEIIYLPTTNLVVSICRDPTVVLETLHPTWTRALRKYNLPTAITKFSLIAIWISSPESSTRRVVDNDTAYSDWYDAVRSGRIDGDGQTLCFEFIESGERETEEPKSKKRKQDEMRRGTEDESGVEISLDVWKIARQTRFQGFE